MEVMSHASVQGNRASDKRTPEALGEKFVTQLFTQYINETLESNAWDEEEDQSTFVKKFQAQTMGQQFARTSAGQKLSQSIAAPFLQLQEAEGVHNARAYSSNN